MLPLLAAGISGATSLLGASMASKATKEANAANRAAQEQANRTAIALRDQDHERQERFAKSGIQWRAADAAAAGIHPLYALGANVPTYSPSPVQVGASTATADTSMGSAVASMGQDIGRAINSTRTPDQRDAAYVKTVQDLSLQKMGLENTLLASQIKRLQANANPPFPQSAPGSTASDVLKFPGFNLTTDPNISPAEDWENRHGELAGDLMGLMVMYNDWKHTTGGNMKVPWTGEQVGRKVFEFGDWLDRNVKVSPGSFAETRQYLPNFMRAPQYRTGTAKYGPR